MPDVFDCESIEMRLQARIVELESMLRQTEEAIETVNRRWSSAVTALAAECEKTVALRAKVERAAAEFEKPWGPRYSFEQKLAELRAILTAPEPPTSFSTATTQEEVIRASVERHK